MINFLDTQAICILIFFLSIIVLCCMAVHYACTRFGTLKFSFTFELTARDIPPKSPSLTYPQTSSPTHPQTPSL